MYYYFTNDTAEVRRADTVNFYEIHRSTTLQLYPCMRSFIITASLVTYHVTTTYQLDLARIQVKLQVTSTPYLTYLLLVITIHPLNSFSSNLITVV